MTRWALLGVGALLLVVVVGGYAWAQRDTVCTFALTGYGGTVPPGGPQTADDALEDFLASGQTNAGTGEAFPADLDDYDERVASGEGSPVTFTSGSTTIEAERTANGWFISSAGTTC